MVLNSKLLMVIHLYKNLQRVLLSMYIHMIEGDKRVMGGWWRLLADGSIANRTAAFLCGSRVDDRSRACRYCKPAWCLLGFTSVSGRCRSESLSFEFRVAHMYMLHPCGELSKPGDLHASKESSALYRARSSRLSPQLLVSTRRSEE